MKHLKLIAGLSLMVLITLLVSFVSNSTEIAAFAHAHGVGAAYSFMFGDPSTGMVLANTPALLTSFSRDVETIARPNNGFLQYALDESDNVRGEKVVSPVEGGDPTGITNPKIFPLEVEQNDDDSHEWPISLHATKPQRISDETELLLNYNSRQLVIGRHQAVINNMIAREMLYNWSPTISSAKLDATGASVPSLLTKWGATGNRKVAGKDDIIDAIRYLGEDDEDENLYMLCPVGFHANLLKISDFIDYNKTGRSDMLAKGFIGEIMGAKVLRRSTGLIYNAAGQPIKVKEVAKVGQASFSVAGDALSGILIWNANCVTKAIGPMTPYIDPKSGALLGSTVNFSQRAGGKLRKDQKGVVAILEKAV